MAQRRKSSPDAALSRTAAQVDLRVGPRVGIHHNLLTGGDTVDDQVGVGGRVTSDHAQGDRAELVVPGRAADTADPAFTQFDVGTDLGKTLGGTVQVQHVTSWPSGYVSTRAPGAWSRQWVDSLCPVAAAATQHTNRRKSTTGAVQLSDARRAAVHPRTGAVGRVGPHAGRAAGRRAADYAAVRARPSRYPGPAPGKHLPSVRRCRCLAPGSTKDGPRGRWWCGPGGSRSR